MQKGTVPMAIVVALAGLPMSPALAQTQVDEAGANDDIIVTATKQAGGIRVHDAPIAVTAVSEAQLEGAQFRDLTAVNVMVPNVRLSGTQVARGSNNLSIRGMGLYSTVPTSTSTVGVFVDGVYLGTNAGTVLDTFDLQSLEVLRGPQGLLFGRNATAGAILIRTTDPTDDFRATFKGSMESGPNFTYSAALSGPVAPWLLFKLAGYRNDDQGYFHNFANDNRHFGKSTTDIVRGAVKVEPGGPFEQMFKAEYGRSKGDGPAGQNHAVYSRNSLDFAIDTEGYIDVEWTQLSSESNLEVGPGNGAITNILGYRRVTQSSLTDVDATPVQQFDAYTSLGHEQLSNELRYSGTIGRATITLGLFGYADRLDYVERRRLLGGAVDSTGGGRQTSETLAAFSNIDLKINEDLTLNLGARYSVEWKKAKVDALSATATSPCSLTTRACTRHGFNDAHKWEAFTPKIGLQWRPDPDTHIYGFWTQGHRSGGYNIRQTNPLAPPGPYDDEIANAFEIGLKKELLDGRVRLNLAGFFNQYRDLQRDIIRPDPNLGSLQITANTADADIWGVELELGAELTDTLMFQFNAGHLGDQLKNVKFDLSGDGVVNGADRALRLPSLSPWTISGALVWTQRTAAGDWSARLSYQHASKAFAIDSNQGVLNATRQLDASLSFTLPGPELQISLFGKNLLNRTTFGQEAILPFAPGQTFAPLNKGRILGAEIRYSL